MPLSAPTSSGPHKPAVLPDILCMNRETREDAMTVDGYVLLDDRSEANNGPKIQRRALKCISKGPILKIQI